MLKKIFICFFVVFLLTTMVVPAFASSSGGSGSGYISPGVVISNVKVLNGSHSGSVLDWPNNYASTDGRDVIVDTAELGFECSNNGTEFSTYVYPGSATSLQINIADMFWTPNLSFSIDNDDFYSVVLTSVSVSGTIITCHPSSGSGAYLLGAGFFSNTFSVNSTSCSLSKLIRDAVGDIYNYGDIVFLQNVRITLNFYNDDPDTSSCMVVRVSEAEYSDYFTAWFDSCNLMKTVIYQSNHPENIFKWLLDSVNAFLEFELIPGFTLNKIFYIAVVIGVLLWALKALS